MKTTPEKILFHIQKSIPKKRKRNTAKDFSGGRTAGAKRRRREARMESPRNPSVRESTKPPRARRVRSQSLCDW